MIQKGNIISITVLAFLLFFGVLFSQPVSAIGYQTSDLEEYPSSLEEQDDVYTGLFSCSPKIARWAREDNCEEFLNEYTGECDRDAIIECRQWKQEQKSLALKREETGDDDDCIDCMGAGETVLGLAAILAGPVSNYFINREWSDATETVGMWQADAYGKHAEALKEFPKACVSGFNSYLDHRSQLGINSALSIDGAGSFFDQCSSLSQYAGFSGHYGNAFGGHGNIWNAAGYSPGFRAGMIGPGFYGQGHGGGGGIHSGFAHYGGVGGSLWPALGGAVLGGLLGGGGVGAQVSIGGRGGLGFPYGGVGGQFSVGASGGGYPGYFGGHYGPPYGGGVGAQVSIGGRGGLGFPYGGVGGQFSVGASGGGYPGYFGGHYGPPYGGGVGAQVSIGGRGGLGFPYGGVGGQFGVGASGGGYPGYFGGHYGAGLGYPAAGISGGVSIGSGMPSFHMGVPGVNPHGYLAGSVGVSPWMNGGGGYWGGSGGWGSQTGHWNRGYENYRHGQGRGGGGYDNRAYEQHQRRLQRQGEQNSAVNRRVAVAAETQGMQSRGLYENFYNAGQDYYGQGMINGGGFGSVAYGPGSLGCKTAYGSYNSCHY